MARQIVVDILGDASKFTKATKDAQTSAQKFGSAISSGLGIGAGIGAFTLLSSAVGGTVDFLKDAVQAGMEEEASIAKLSASLQANIPAWDGRTDAIEKVLKAQIDLGFSDDEQRDSMSMLVVATKNVAEAQAIQTTAMDLARLKGISLADATSALIKVEAGQYRALKGLGIVLKEGATQTEALAAVQAVAEGQAATFAMVTGGKLLVAQTKFGEKMDELGTILLPLVSDGISLVTGSADLLAASMNILLPWMRDFGDAADALPLTIETNTNAANVLAATWGTLGTAAWMQTAAIDAVASSLGEIGTSSEREAARIRAAITTASDVTTATVTRNNDAQLVSYATLASYLLGSYNEDYSTALGIQEARADIHNAKTAADRVEAYAELEALGANSKTDYANWIAALEEMAKGTKGKVHDAYVAAIADVKALRDAALNPIIFNVIYQRRYTGKPLPDDEGGVTYIPGAATGGRRSGLTWVGEEGPELVNLPGGSYVNSNSASMGMTGGLSIGSVNISGVNDPEAIARLILQPLRRELSRQGMSLG